MAPEDVRSVQASWPALVSEREQLQVALARQFPPHVAATPEAATARACWLFNAVEELVGLLQAPSRLEVRARHLGDTWPDRRHAPSYAVDGAAWMRAAFECVPSWSADVERAWRQAWLLLSEVLAAETLSPFAGDSSSAGR
jgi:hypothetical protein